MRARVVVTLKSGVLDPQGKAIEGALGSLGIAGIRGVRQGKVFDIELDGDDRDGAERALSAACERLLANTVIENFKVELADGPGGPPSSTPAAAASDAFAPDGPVPATEPAAEGRP